MRRFSAFGMLCFGCGQQAWCWAGRFVSATPDRQQFDASKGLVFVSVYIDTVSLHSFMVQRQARHILHNDAISPPPRRSLRPQ